MTSRLKRSLSMSGGFSEAGMAHYSQGEAWHSYIHDLEKGASVEVALCALQEDASPAHDMPGSAGTWEVVKCMHPTATNTSFNADEVVDAQTRTQGLPLFTDGEPCDLGRLPEVLRETGGVNDSSFCGRITPEEQKGQSRPPVFLYARYVSSTEAESLIAGGHLTFLSEICWISDVKRRKRVHRAVHSQGGGGLSSLSSSSSSSSSSSTSAGAPGSSPVRLRARTRSRASSSLSTSSGGDYDNDSSNYGSDGGTGNEGRDHDDDDSDDDDGGGGKAEIGEDWTRVRMLDAFGQYAQPVQDPNVALHEADLIASSNFQALPHYAGICPLYARCPTMRQGSTEIFIRDVRAVPTDSQLPAGYLTPTRSGNLPFVPRDGTDDLGWTLAVAPELERPFECPYPGCGASYHTQRRLELHRRTVHPVRFATNRYSGNEARFVDETAGAKEETGGPRISGSTLADTIFDVPMQMHTVLEFFLDIAVPEEKTFKLLGGDTAAEEATSGAAPGEEGAPPSSPSKKKSRSSAGATEPGQNAFWFSDALSMSDVQILYRAALNKHVPPQQREHGSGSRGRSGSSRSVRFDEGGGGIGGGGVGDDDDAFGQTSTAQRKNPLGPLVVDGDSASASSTGDAAPKAAVRRAPVSVTKLLSLSRQTGTMEPVEFGPSQPGTPWFSPLHNIGALDDKAGDSSVVLGSIDVKLPLFRGKSNPQEVRRRRLRDGGGYLGLCVGGSSGLCLLGGLRYLNQALQFEACPFVVFCLC